MFNCWIYPQLGWLQITTKWCMKELTTFIVQVIDAAMDHRFLTFQLCQIMQIFLTTRFHPTCSLKPARKQDWPVKILGEKCESKQSGLDYKSLRRLTWFDIYLAMFCGNMIFWNNKRIDITITNEVSNHEKKHYSSFNKQSKSCMLLADLGWVRAV